MNNTEDKTLNHEQWFLRTINGQTHGPLAAAARELFSLAAPLYANAMLARNLLYSRRLLKAKHALRPVVSVGNLTLGGTGKTPIVAWLAAALAESGRHPAVLLRGYKSRNGQSDEALLLEQLLAPVSPAVPVRANPDRYAAAIALTAQQPAVDAFVLDDGFQHRKLARHFDLVLIDATNPFGNGKVLPRGPLREPMRALRRVGAVLLTRTDLVDAEKLAQIESTVRCEQAGVPIYRCAFEMTLSNEIGDVPLDTLANAPVFAACGIGNPLAFFEQLRRAGANVVGTRAFADHHAYNAADVQAIADAAQVAGAQQVLVTGKDWVKLAPLLKSQSAIEFHRVGQRVRFAQGNDQQLLQQITEALQSGDRILGWKNPQS